MAIWHWLLANGFYQILLMLAMGSIWAFLTGAALRKRLGKLWREHVDNQQQIIDGQREIAMRLAPPRPVRSEPPFDWSAH